MKLQYKWSNFVIIESILSKIYYNTLATLSNEDKCYAEYFINYLEDFIYNMLKHNYDINKILNAIENISSISFLAPDAYKSNIIGINYSSQPKVVIRNNQILLSKFIEDGEYLTKEERLRLYLYKGLCRYILKFKNDKTKQFSKIYHNILKDSLSGEEIENLVDNGWLLLEDAISQEISESLVYSIVHKKRPGLSYGGENKDDLIIDKTRILSNYDSNRLFQPILVMFGWTLNKVGSVFNHSNYIIEKDIINKAMNQSFSENVIIEYICKGEEFSLFQLLYMMGILLNAKYKEFGINISNKISSTKEDNNKIFEGICELTMRLSTLDEEEYNSELIIPEYSSNDITKHKLLTLIRNNEPYIKKYNP